MGKISPVSIKYTIYATFEAQGGVEKPDVIGALFGQTEGLLGSELEMRELQKEGKIGRIEVSMDNKDGKTVGKIEIPSALDKAETALIAASIETIDRIGPTDAKIEVLKIEDVRGEKRGYIVDRAKKLLEQIQGTNNTREMADDLKTQSRLSKLQEYGEERLPAGDISEHEIIVVEGRADVVNLMKNGVSNVIGMNGTNLPKTIKELSYDKEVTLFVDGDRGGRLIAKNVCDNARIDYVAIAPDGKEVEELVGKEILQALRRKVSASDFFRQEKRDFKRRFEDSRFSSNNNSAQDNQVSSAPMQDKQVSSAPVTEEKEENVELDKEKFKEIMNQLEGTKSALFLDSKLEIINEVSSKGISLALRKSRKQVYVIILDGLVTSNVVRAAEESGVKAIAARNFAFTDTKINLISV